MCANQACYISSSESLSWPTDSNGMKTDFCSCMYNPDTRKNGYVVHFNLLFFCFLLQIIHTSGRINLDVWPSAENVVQTFSWPQLVVAGALQTRSFGHPFLCPDILC